VFETQETTAAAAGAPSGKNSLNGETALAIEAAAKKPRTNGDGRGTTSAGAMKISVLLPNYNHGAFIKQNIEAVRAQTYRDWELVIVDDGSTDDSAATIRALAELDRRIAPVFLLTNRGVMFVVEAGLAATTETSTAAADDHIASAQLFERASRHFATSQSRVPEGHHDPPGETPGKWVHRRHMASFHRDKRLRPSTGGLFVPGAAATGSAPISTSRGRGTWARKRRFQSCAACAIRSRLYRRGSPAR
jgi:hypothetical protein